MERKKRKKPRGCGCLLPLLAFPLLLILMFFSMIGKKPKQDESLGFSNAGKQLSDAVLKHRALVTKFCKQYGIEGKEMLVLAIMQVESGGNSENTKDVMQASESKGLPPNSISSVEESIETGVSYLAGLFQSAKEMNLDDWSVVQSYNYGGGFLYYVNNNGKRYSFDLAEKFSAEKADYKKVPYINEISKKAGKPYLYAYGNMFYVPLVQQYIKREGGSHSTGSLIFPIEAPEMTSDYKDSRSAITGGEMAEHLGVDFISRTKGDQAPILAVAAGEVIGIEWNSGGGNMISIKHSDNLYTQYAHLSKVSVSVGDRVVQGEEIGIVGMTGLYVTGVHIHFQISTTPQWWDSHQNPWDYLPPL